MQEYFEKTILPLISEVLNEPSKSIPIFVIAAFLLQRLWIFRYLRKYLYYVVAPALLIYRTVYHSRSDKSVLEQFLEFVYTLPLSAISSAISSAEATRIRFFLSDLLGFILFFSVVKVLAVGFSMNLTTLSSYLIGEGFKLVKDLPAIKSKLDEEKKKMESSFEGELKVKARNIGRINETLPKEGLPHDQILKIMRDATTKENVVWKEGKVSGAVYHGKSDHQALLNEAFGMYSLANPLHPDIWPSGMKFESEIIAMAASLVSGGNPRICGCTTSGGTESILLAIKSHRDYYLQEYGITAPEVIFFSSCKCNPN